MPVRLVSASVLGPALALLIPGLLVADVQRVAALRTLAVYWATQVSSPGGWLDRRADPAFVPVAPPDSSLWSPGTVLLLSETEGFRQIGSREKFIPARSVKVLGKERSDVAVLDTLSFGPERGDGFRLQDLPGVLEAFGVVRTQSATLSEDLKAELDRFGVRRVMIRLPDAQVHRLAASDLEAYLAEDASDATRRLLAQPSVRVITSAVFLRTVQFRLEADKSVSGLTEVLERLLGTDLKPRSDGSLKCETGGVYVAIQTARFRTQVESATGREAVSSLTDTTQESRDIIARLLARL